MKQQEISTIELKNPELAKKTAIKDIQSEDFLSPRLKNKRTEYLNQQLNIF